MSTSPTTRSRWPRHAKRSSGSSRSADTRPSSWTASPGSAAWTKTGSSSAAALLVVVRAAARVEKAREGEHQGAQSRDHRDAHRRAGRAQREVGDPAHYGRDDDERDDGRAGRAVGTWSHARFLSSREGGGGVAGPLVGPSLRAWTRKNSEW